MRKLAAIFCFVVIFSTTACHKRYLADRTVLVKTRAVDTSHPRATLVTASKGLRGRIIMIEPRFREVGKLSQVQIGLQNVSRDRHTLEYQFEWRDSNGFIVDTPKVWHRMPLGPQEIKYINSTGKTPDADHIVMTIRYPDDYSTARDLFND